MKMHEIIGSLMNAVNGTRCSNIDGIGLAIDVSVVKTLMNLSRRRCGCEVDFVQIERFSRDPHYASTQNALFSVTY